MARALEARRDRAGRIRKAARWLGAAFLAFQAVAFAHAWRFTHFVEGGARTRPPERLGVTGKIRVLLTGVTYPRPKNRRTPADAGIPFETARVPSGDGMLELWFVPGPQDAQAARPAAAVLLFPAYGASRDSMLEEAAAFHRAGHPVLLVDFRGCGGSSGDTTSLGVREAADVAAAVTWARSRMPNTPLVLYGRSMGAAAVLRAVAREGVAPEGIILECPFDTLLHAVRNRFRVMGVPSFPAAESLTFWGGVQQGFWAFGHRPVDDARAVPCPALVLHGEADQRATEEQARAVFAALNTTDKQMQVFPGVAHASCLAADPAAWHAGVSQLLERAGRRAR